MPLAPFALEVWLAAREAAARWDLSSTGMGALTLAELQQRGLEPPDFAQVGLGYGALSGSLALRTALARHYYAGNPQTILVTQGAIEANLLAISALLEPGERVVTFTPGYQQFKSWPEFLGATVIDWPLTDLNSLEDFAPELTFLVNLEDLPKLIILNNPHNPTGKCFSPTWLTQLVHWCAQRGVWLLCDEVYRDLQLGGPGRKPSLADFGYERIVVTSSFSKSLGLPGLRIGWLHGPTTLLERCRQFKDYLTISPASFSDCLATALLAQWERIWPVRYREFLLCRQRFEAVVKYPAPPAGAFGWLPVTDPALRAQQWLTDQQLLVVPGTCFGDYPALRIGFGRFERPDWWAAVGQLLSDCADQLS